MANNGWGSDSKPAQPSRSSGWSQDSLRKETVPTAPQGTGKIAVTEQDFVLENTGALIELFGVDFKMDPRYKLLLAEILENKRSVHMILADYRPRASTSRGGAGW